VVWTGGIQPSPIVQTLDLPKDNYGRILINEFHQVPTHTNVYVVGDCASLPFSPSAQAAQQQGKQIAEVLSAIWRDRAPRLTPIKLKGVLGSLGKKAGFGTMGRSQILGKLPRAMKNGVLWMSKHHFG
jgi:NADH dehydrogenase